MKKLIALLLCAVMVFSAFPFVASASKFVDVENGKWYSEGIEYCVANGFMAGTSATTFERKTVLSRAMFVTILASLDRAFTEPYADMQMFDDVAPGKWYSGAVNWAASNGLASGIGGGLFGYKNPVSREQMAVFLKAYIDFCTENYYYVDLDYADDAALPFDINARADLSVFKDADSVHSWAEDAMSWAVAVGLFSGVDAETLDPRGSCTREQTAVIIHAFQKDVIYGDCRHSIVPATCFEPAYCRFCNLTYGFAEHEYGDNGICVICGAMFDPSLNCGHVWIEATCTESAWCWRCFAEGEEAHGHDMVLSEDGLYYECQNEFLYSECSYIECAGEHLFIDPTCNNWGYCENCYIDGEEPLYHDPDENGICTNCGGEYDPEYDCVHDFVDPECVFLGYCWMCGKINGDALGHDYGEDNCCTRCGDILCNDHVVTLEPDCWSPSFCDSCGDVIDDALGHESDESNHCIRCGLEYDPEYNCFHEWYSDDCEYGMWCWNCGKILGPMDHDYDDSGYCVICGMSSCTEHIWVGASCSADGYCSNCLEINPDDPAKGHSFDEGELYCSACGVFHDPELSAHENLVKNIEERAFTNVDGNLEIKNTYEEEGGTASVSLLKRQGNDEVVSILKLDEAESSVRLELALDDTPESYTFILDIAYDGEPVLSVNGEFDPVDFCTNGSFINLDYFIENTDMVEDDPDTVAFSCMIMLAASIMTTEVMLGENSNLSISDYGFDFSFIGELPLP